jgi:KipI family sensor histidine kinase inhibitor
MLPLGDRAVLVEVDSLDHVLALSQVLGRSRPDGVTDVVPAARTVAVTIDPARISLGATRAWLQSAETFTAAGAYTAESAAAVVGGKPVEIVVDYDGEDLVEVADLLGMGVDEVVDLHTGSLWRAAFGGFAPGFAYMVTDHDRLTVPRRSSPRTSVPAGSVALAGEFSGVYPRSSPGGWQLIGRTDATLWDSTREPPALIAPGSVVRFVRRP